MLGQRQINAKHIDLMPSNRSLFARNDFPFVIRVFPILFRPSHLFALVLADVFVLRGESVLGSIRSERVLCLSVDFPLRFCKYAFARVI